MITFPSFASLKPHLEIQHDHISNLPFSYVQKTWFNHKDGRYTIANKFMINIDLGMATGRGWGGEGVPRPPPHCLLIPPDPRRVPRFPCGGTREINKILLYNFIIVKF